MARRIFLRIAYAGRERLIEAPADMCVARLAEIVGRAFAPTDASEEVVRYELCLSGVPLAESERIGRACVSIQPGQALQLCIVRERMQPMSVDAHVEPPKGSIHDAAWVLGGRALAVAGEWGVQLWDAETQRWQPSPIVSLSVLRIATHESLLIGALKHSGIALWEFNDAEQRWYGRANKRLPSAHPITSLALNATSVAVGTALGSLYWVTLPDLEYLEMPSKQSLPIQLLYWMDTQHCIKLNATSIEVWRFGEVRPTLEAPLTAVNGAAPHTAIGAARVSTVDASWVLVLLAAPMHWIWVSLSGMRPIAVAQSGHSDPISLAYAAKSRIAWVGFADGTVEAWQVTDAGQPLERRARHTLSTAPLRQVLVSPNERWLVSIRRDNLVEVHSTHELSKP